MRRLAGKVLYPGAPPRGGSMRNLQMTRCVVRLWARFYDQPRIRLYDGLFRTGARSQVVQPLLDDLSGR